jgi:hypothetical protein
MLIASIHDLDPPASPILAFSVADLQAATGECEGLLKSCVEIG